MPEGIAWNDSSAEVVTTLGDSQVLSIIVDGERKRATVVDFRGPGIPGPPGEDGADGADGAPGSGAGVADFGSVALDSFAGANDDAKLTAALSAVGADTFPRTIQLTNRSYSFATAGRVPFESMRIAGPRGYSNPERNGGTSEMACRLHLTGTGAWFASTAEVFSVSMSNLSFVGGSGAWVIGGGSNWYCLSMRDIFASGLRSVIGSISQKCLLTAASFTGDWEINNCYDLFFHGGGSDNVFWSDGILIDAAVAYDGAGQAHIWMDGMDKSYVGPIYCTARGEWSAIRQTGQAFNSTGSNQGAMYYNGCRIEGMNPDTPTYGALVRVEGGIAIFHGCNFNFAMADPSNAGIGRTDLGVIQHTGGQLIVDNCTYDRANGVSETVPFVYTNTSADCCVTKIMRSSRGGTWTGRPRVAKPAANPENRVVYDGTVTLINA